MLKAYFLKKFYQKIKWAVLFSGLALSGACATFGGTTQTLPPGGATTESVVTACSAYATVLKSLTPLKPTMSASEISTVGKSILLTSPVCSNPSSYNTNGALQAILAETANLKTILANGGK